MRQRGIERGWCFEQVAHDFGLLLAVKAPLPDRHMRGKRGQHGKLAGEGLGRGDADFRPRVRRQQQVSLARHGAGRHVDDHADGLAVGLAVPERRQRVCRLAALRDEQRQPALFQHRIAISELGCHIDVDRHPRELLEPVFRHHPGIEGGAAGDDGQAADARKVEIDLRQRHRIVRPAQVGAERLRDHGGLLVDLLLHEVAIVALFDRRSRSAREADFAGDGVVRRIVHLGAVTADHHPVAFFEIGDTLGERGERERVRAEIHLGLVPVRTVAHHQRRAQPRAYQEVGSRAESDGERKGPAQARQYRAHRRHRIGPALDLGRDQVGDNLAIGLALEHAPLGGEFGAQLLEVLDDAVVDNRHLARRMRVGVGCGRRAVGGPTGVGDADIARCRIAGKHCHQIGKPSFRPPPHQRTIMKRADPGAVIAAIFHALEPVDQAVGNAALADDPDDAAHLLLFFPCSNPPCSSPTILNGKPNHRGRPASLGKKQPLPPIHHFS